MDIPGCAGGCHNCWVRRDSPVLGRHSLLAVRSLPEGHRRNSAHSVRRSRPESRSRQDVVAAAALHVAIGRSPAVAVHHRTVLVEARSSCCGSVAVHVAQAAQIVRIDHLVGKTWEVQFQCRCHSIPKTRYGCIRSR